MANITTLKLSGTEHPTRAMMNTPYVVENFVNFADITTAKGSAVAAADTVEVFSIPAGTIVLNAGLQCIIPDNATTLTLDMGYTGGDVDEFVAGFDHAAAAAFAYSAYLATDPLYIAPTNAATLVSVLVATLTGAATVGQFRAWALVADVSPKRDVAPAIAALKS